MRRCCLRAGLWIAVWGAVANIGMAQFGAVGEIVEPSSAFRAVREKDGYVYVLDRDGTLKTFDLTDHSGSEGFQSYAEPIDTQLQRGNGRDLLIVDDFLYTFHRPGGVDAYSLSDPAAPAFESNLSGFSAQSAVEESGFLFAVRDGLSMISLDDPAQPQLVQPVGLQDNGWAIGSGGGYLYVSSANFQTRVSSIEVFDFTNPPTLTSVGVVEVGSQDNLLPYVIHVVDSLLVTCATTEIVFWNLWDPAKPAVMGRVPIQNGRGCAVYDRYVVANGVAFELRPPFLQVGTFPPGGNQADGAPYRSTARPNRLLLTQSGRVLLLQAPPAAALPQYADGEAGGFENRSRVILENRGDVALAGEVIFRRPEGYAVPAPAGAEEGPPDPVPFVLAPLGSFEFTTDGTGPLTAGPAEVRLETIESADLKVTLIYELLGNFVSVDRANLGTRHGTYVTRNEDENTAIALFNPSPADTAVFRTRLLDDQGLPQTDFVEGSLSPGEQKALFMTDEDLFGDQVPEDFRGRFFLEVQNDKPIYSLAIIQRTDGALLAVQTSVQR